MYYILCAERTRGVPYCIIREITCYSVHMGKLSFGLLISLILTVTSCSKDRWDGYIYPDKEKTLIQHHIGTFTSKEECRKASLAMLETEGVIDTGFSECGKNCTASGSYYSRGCEEMVRYNIYK